MRTMFLLLAIGGCVGGCVEDWNNAKPVTRVKVRPMEKAVELEDSKNNDIGVEELGYDPSTGAFKIKNMTIINNASDVRKANADQINAQANYATAFAQGIALGINAAAQFMPGVQAIMTQRPTVTTPYGSLGWTQAPPAPPAPVITTQPATQPAK